MYVWQLASYDSPAHFSFVAGPAEDAVSFDPAVDILVEQMNAVLVDLSMKHKDTEAFWR